MGSISALVIEAKSLISAGRLGGELRLAELLKFRPRPRPRPRYLRVDSGLDSFGLVVVFFGHVSMSLSSSELSTASNKKQS